MRKFSQPVAMSERMQASTNGYPVSPLAHAASKAASPGRHRRPRADGVHLARLDGGLAFKLLHEVAMPVQPPGERNERLPPCLCVGTAIASQIALALPRRLRDFSDRERARGQIGRQP